MTETVMIAMMSGFVSIVSAYFAFRAKVISESTHTAVNSRLTELLEVTRQLAMSEGIAKEKLDEIARQALALKKANIESQK